MKPRTKIQKEVEALRMKLPQITTSQKKWAREKCFDDVGYVCKGEVWCSHCGGVHIRTIPELGVALEVYKKVSCPYCRSMLRLQNSRAKKKEMSSVMSIVTTLGGWQVIRHIEVKKYLYKLPKNVDADKSSVYMSEVVQQWVNEKGECVVVAKPRAYGYGKWSWAWTGEMSIKNISRLYSYEQEMYNIVGNVYPYKKVLPILRRNGYDGYIPRGASMCDLFKILLKSKRGETIIKAKQYGLLEWMLRTGGYQDWIWPSVRIAIRNGYQVKEAEIWYDMLDALRYLGKDLRNRFYVCPKNLREAHDKWIKLMEKERDKKKREEELKRIMGWEDVFKKQKSRFFGVMIESEGIIIRPIMSVEEMAEEGKKMHHCVFAQGYYKRKESLILSAKDSEGNRLETIEVIISTGKVNQCFGAFNQHTEHHEKILRIMKENMDVIMKAV